MENNKNIAKGLGSGSVFFRYVLLKLMHNPISVALVMCFWGEVSKILCAPYLCFAHRALENTSYKNPHLGRTDIQNALVAREITRITQGSIFKVSKLLDMFWESVVEDDINRLKILLHLGVPVNLTDASGQSALMLATKLGQEDMVAFLIDQNIELDLVNNRGETALMKAVEKNSEKLVHTLLSAGAWPFLVNNEGLTAGAIAEKKVHIPVLIMIRMKGVHLWHSFHEAVIHNDKQYVMSYLQKNGPVNTVNPQGHTALMLAVLHNRIEILGLLMQEQQDFNRLNNLGFTALMIAAVHKNTDMMKILLQSKEVDCNARSSKGETAVMMTASDCSSVELTELLVKAGADMTKSDHTGFTSLLRAEVCGCTDTVSYLLEEHVGLDYPYLSMRASLH